MKSFIVLAIISFAATSCVISAGEKGGLEARPDFNTWVKIFNIFAREEQK